MKKIIAVILCAVLLCGCQLAKEDAAEGKSQDRMIGVMITEESLSLFDMEAYIGDHASDFVGGGDVTIEDSSRYSQRIYANMEKGCVFEDVEGILFAYYENADGITCATGAEGISDGHNDVKENGSEISWDMTGTIYVDDRIGEVCFFYNPVYQDEAGRVYLTEGTGSTGNVLEGSNMTMTHTLSESFEETRDGKTKSYQADIQITVSAITLAERYVLISMDKNHQEIARQEYTPEQLPYEITPADGAAYLLIESHSTTTEGEPFVTRTIHSSDDESQWLDVFAPQEDGICIKGKTRVVWPDTQ